MKVYTNSLSLKTSKRLEIIDISGRVSDMVRASGVENGLVTLWVDHTTAALAINENDPSLWEDILSAFTRLVPLDADYNHNRRYRGLPSEQNAHAHILNCLIEPDTTIPLRNKEMMLGTWQSILFIELDGPRSRYVNIHVIGE